MSEIIVKYGRIRPLTREERSYLPAGRHYTLVVTEPYFYQRGYDIILVPKGFLSDGATLAPDIGRSWIYHDYLYATHCYRGERYCSRREADRVLCDIASHEGLQLAPWLAGIVFWLNLFTLPQRAWIRSGTRGAEYLTDFIQDLQETERSIDTDRDIFADI